MSSPKNKGGFPDALMMGTPSPSRVTLRVTLGEDSSDSVLAIASLSHHGADRPRMQMNYIARKLSLRGKVSSALIGISGGASGFSGEPGAAYDAYARSQMEEIFAGDEKTSTARNNCRLSAASKKKLVLVIGDLNLGTSDNFCLPAMVSFLNVGAK